MSRKPPLKVKDLKTIDKEILNTRKHLEEFQNHLEKKSECLISTILDFEKVRENTPKSPVVVKLNELEMAHYFNLHLDSLEHSMLKNQQNEKKKSWRPVEVKSSPVISVITTLKDYDCNQYSSDNMAGDVQLLEMFDLEPFHITGKSLETPLETKTEEKYSNNVVPNNSPSFDVSDGHNKLAPKKEEIIQNVLKTWRFYVKKRKAETMYTEKTKKFEINLMKKLFSLWMSYVKQRKVAEGAKQIKSSESRLHFVPNKCCINNNFELDNNSHSDESHKYHLQVDQAPNNNCREVQNNILNIDIISNKVCVFSTNKNEKCAQFSKSVVNTSDKLEVHVKTLTPLDVGLTENSHTEETELCRKHSRKKVQDMKNLIVLRKHEEPLLNRFEAQEKIIKKQRDHIEKQNKIIFDLQAKCLEIESKLNWALAERQLAEAEIQIGKVSSSSNNSKTKKSVSVHSITQDDCRITKTQENSEKLVKRMLERQAYCSQLAEQTKLRKKRIAEEKERLKVEQEEKKKQKKEEEKKKKILQMKLEKQVAEEKDRYTQALKEKDLESTEKAKIHYRSILVRKSFVALRGLCLEISVKSDECSKIYRRKLMHKTFNFWKEEVKHRIESKNQLADTYYKGKLVRQAWNKLRKVHHDYKMKWQVSEDLYSLKLQERMFHRWEAFAAQQFLQNCCKIQLAERLYRRRLLRWCFYHWKEVPRLMFKEREKEQRRRAWRHSVQQLIPDFAPAISDDI